jgi:hypothetical protein
LVAKVEESTFLRYALAPACIAIAVLLNLSVAGPFLHPTGLFLAAIVAAAWFGGAGPGFLSALLATFALPQLIQMNYPLVAGSSTCPASWFGITAWLLAAAPLSPAGKTPCASANSSFARP